MAFYDPQEDEDQQDPNAQVPGVQTQSGSSVITGQGGAPGGGANQPKTNSPDRPGNFVNLQDYLNANKSQSEKLGTQASGVINQSADTARQSVSSLNQEAADKIKPTNYLSTDVSDKIKNGAENLTPEERTAAKNTASASYQGPQSYADLSSYQSAADATQKASQNIDNSGTEQGRMGLISQINAKPRTQGMNVFDNALLQSGTGRDKLAQAADANQDVKGGLDSASQAIQGQIGRADDPSTPDIDESTGAIGQTNKAQADASKQIQDALAAWTQGFQPKVTAAQQNLTGWENKVNADIRDNPYDLSPDVLAASGLNQGERLYGLNLNTYLNPLSPSDINAGNVADQQDYARYGALADLAGETNPLLDQANIAQAGTAPSNASYFNSSKLIDDRNAAEQAFNELAAKTQLSGTGYSSSSNRGGEIANESIQDYLNNGIKAATIQNGHPETIDPGSAADAQNHLSSAILEWLKNNNYNSVVNEPGPTDLTPQPIKIRT